MDKIVSIISSINKSMSRWYMHQVAPQVGQKWLPYNPFIGEIFISKKTLSKRSY